MLVVGGVGGWVVLGQGPVEVGGFLGGLQGLMEISIENYSNPDSQDKLVWRGGVGGWVVLGRGPVGRLISAAHWANSHSKKAVRYPPLNRACSALWALSGST